MTAANHRERVGTIEKTAARQGGDGLLAGVDQVGIDFILCRKRSDTQQSIFALQPHIHAFRNVVGHQGR